MVKLFAASGVALLFLVGCATPGSSQGELRTPNVNLSAVRNVVLTVHGLSCPLCSNNLDGQLRQIDGVEKATIDLKTGAVSVGLAEDHSVTAGDLAKAVEQAGFTLKNMAPAGDGK